MLHCSQPEMKQFYFHSAQSSSQVSLYREWKNALSLDMYLPQSKTVTHTHNSTTTHSLNPEKLASQTTSPDSSSLRHTYSSHMPENALKTSVRGALHTDQVSVMISSSSALTSCAFSLLSVPSPSASAVTAEPSFTHLWNDSFCLSTSFLLMPVIHCTFMTNFSWNLPLCSSLTLSIPLSPRRRTCFSWTHQSLEPSSYVMW